MQSSPFYLPPPWGPVAEFGFASGGRTVQGVQRPYTWSALPTGVLVWVDGQGASLRMCEGAVPLNHILQKSVLLSK